MFFVYTYQLIILIFPGQSNKPKDGQDPHSKPQDAKPSREGRVLIFICIYFEWLFSCNLVEPKTQTSAEQQPGPSGQQKHVKGKQSMLLL